MSDYYPQQGYGKGISVERRALFDVLKCIMSNPEIAKIVKRDHPEIEEQLDEYVEIAKKLCDKCRNIVF